MQCIVTVVSNPSRTRLTSTIVVRQNEHPDHYVLKPNQYIDQWFLISVPQEISKCVAKLSKNISPLLRNFFLVDITFLGRKSRYAPWSKRAANFEKVTKRAAGTKRLRTTDVDQKLK